MTVLTSFDRRQFTQLTHLLAHKKDEFTEFNVLQLATPRCTRENKMPTSGCDLGFVFWSCNANAVEIGLSLASLDTLFILKISGAH